MMTGQTKTLESLVADAVLQKPLGTIRIDGVEYPIDRPRIQTHILISEAIGRLPYVKQTDRVEEQVMEVLRVAKEGTPVICEIAALLILGPKPRTEQRVVERKYLFGLIKIRKTISVDLKKELAEKLLCELSPVDCKNLIVECLGYQQIPVFFGVITSLYGANLLKPTSEVPTTVYGL